MPIDNNNTMDLDTTSASITPWIYPMHPSTIGNVIPGYLAFPRISVKPIYVNLNIGLLEQLKSVLAYSGGAFASIAFILRNWNDPIPGRNFAFPMTSVSSELLSGSGEGWNTNGMDSINKFMDFLRRDPIQVPNYTATGGGKGYKVSSSFTIYNVDKTSLQQNYYYIINLMRLNTQHTIDSSVDIKSKDGLPSLASLGGAAYHYQQLVPPCLYVVLIPGIAWVPACKLSYTVTPVGVSRQYSGNDVLHFGNENSQPLEINMNGKTYPDAWKITFEFEPLVPMKRAFFELAMTDLHIGNIPYSVGSILDNVGFSTLSTQSFKAQANNTPSTIAIQDISFATLEIDEEQPKVTPSSISAEKKISKILPDGTLCFDEGERQGTIEKGGAIKATMRNVFSSNAGSAVLIDSTKDQMENITNG